jgi:hypothetical protein
MKHRTILQPAEGGGFIASDPDVPWLKPSRGRTAEEAVAAFEQRLRYVEVERRKSWAQRTFTWPSLLARLSFEVFRALGLWLLDHGKSHRILWRVGLIVLVVLPAVLAFAVLVVR